MIIRVIKILSCEKKIPNCRHVIGTGTVTGSKKNATQHEGILYLFTGHRYRINYEAVKR